MNGFNDIRFAAETPDDNGEGSDGFDYLHAGNAVYREICAAGTGSIIPDDVFEKGRDRRFIQDEESIATAKALDSTGRFPVKFYKGENDPGRVTVIGCFSNAVLPMPPIHRVSFFPSIAKANRSKMLRDVEHFLDWHPKTSRMFTLTNGPRVPIDRVTLRDDVKGFHRWLSKMAANPNFKRWGLKMQWRATEFGEPEWDANTGQMTLHLHAHCLVTEPETMTDKKRAKLRRKLWKVFGRVRGGLRTKTHWDDGGTIQNAREFVKYPLKDHDRRKILNEGGPGMLADFYEAIRGLHIVQPMGDLKRTRRRFRDTPVRVHARSDGPLGRRLIVDYDYNAQKRPLAPTNKRREAYKKRCLTMAANLAAWAICRQNGTLAADNDGGEAAETANAARSNGIESPPDEDRPSERRPQIGDGELVGTQTPPPINRVIARLAPAPYGGPICEPAVVVWGFNGDVGAVLRQPMVAAIVAAHGRAYQDAEEARALIRACAGALARPASQSSQRSNNCPNDLGDLALMDAENRPPGYVDRPGWGEIEAFRP